MLAFRTIKTPKNVTARMMSFENDEQGRNMRAFFERGNRQKLDALVKFFETGVPQVVR